MGDRDIDLAAGGTFAELSHTHTLADVTNAGTLAALNQVGSAQIADDAVTNVKLANMAAATFKGRAAGAGTGDPTDLSAAQAKTALAISTADVSGLGALATLNQVASAQIADDAVTNAKLANMAAATLQGPGSRRRNRRPDRPDRSAGQNGPRHQRGGRERARRPRDAQPGRLRANRCRGARRQADQHAGRSAPGPRADRLCGDQRDPCDQRGGPHLDLDTASVFEVVLTANVTSLVFANPPTTGRAGSATLILRQDATGGRTVTWPTSILWAGGTAPLVTSAANAVDIYGFITRNGGTTWYGFPAGKGFA